MSHSTRRFRLVASAGMMGMAIVLWAVCFYLPYGWYEQAVFSAYKQDPKGWDLVIRESLFSLLVTVGNQLVYFGCDTASKWVGFRTTDSELRMYMCFYTAAILINMSVDLLVLHWTTNQIESLAFDEVVSAYMGKRLFWYNFPGCFLLPFCAEPLFAVAIPMHLIRKVVATRPVAQDDADKALAPKPMDLGRYADILLNMIQAVISLFFASQYVMHTLLGLLSGQVFIFWWDHFRVLRQVQGFHYSSNATDNFAQKCTAVLCAFLAAAVANRWRWTLDEEKVLEEEQYGWHLVLMSGLTHFFVHTFLLESVVPLLSTPRTKKVTLKPYKDVAQERPVNHFNANAVHCMRSQFLHGHSPPCTFYVQGKEHLLEVNPELGQFYKARRWNLRARSPTVIELFGVQKKRTPGAKLAKRHSGSSYVPVQRMWKLNSDILDNLEGQFRTSQRTLMTFDSWRRRMFYVKRRRDVSWALVLFSQKTGQLELSCELASVNGVATIEDLPEITMIDDAKVLERVNVINQQYEREVSRGKWAADYVETGFPEVLYPFLVRWTDAEEDCEKSAVFACESSTNRFLVIGLLNERIQGSLSGHVGLESTSSLPSASDSVDSTSSVESAFRSVHFNGQPPRISQASAGGLPFLSLFSGRDMPSSWRESTPGFMSTTSSPSSSSSSSPKPSFASFFDLSAAERGTVRTARSPPSPSSVELENVF